MFTENKLNMDKIVKMNGYVYFVEHFERKGFETYHNLGKDMDDPMWKEEVEQMSFNKKKKKTKKETE